MAPKSFRVSLWTGLKRFRADFEGEGVEACALCIDDITYTQGSWQANTPLEPWALHSFRQELDGIGFASPISPRPSVALYTSVYGYVPTPERFYRSFGGALR